MAFVSSCHDRRKNKRHNSFGYHGLLSQQLTLHPCFPLTLKRVSLKQKNGEEGENSLIMQRNSLLILHTEFSISIQKSFYIWKTKRYTAFAVNRHKTHHTKAMCVHMHAWTCTQTHILFTYAHAQRRWLPLFLGEFHLCFWEQHFSVRTSAFESVFKYWIWNNNRPQQQIWILVQSSPGPDHKKYCVWAFLESVIDQLCQH